MTHPLIMLSTVGAMACVAWGLRAQIVRDRKARSLRELVRSQYPEAWKEVPGYIQKWATPYIALSVLAQQRLVSDQVFLERYAEVHDLGFRMMRWVMLGLGLVCIAIIGSRVWGWNWE